ncbi:branched-chain amino acid ABC transporter permease [bacterium]|nr:MAG: branched-chain amino acid ABC transporter permease [bacterium]
MSAMPQSLERSKVKAYTVIHNDRCQTDVNVQPQATAAAKSPRNGSRLRTNALALAGAFAVIALPLLSGNGYIIQVASLAAIGAIMAVSLGILYGHSGQLSFAHAAFYGVGAYTAVVLHTQHGVNFIVSLFAGAALSGLVAFVVGLPTLRLRGNYLAIATMALQLGISEVFVNAKITGGSVGILGIVRPTIAGFSFESPFAYYVLLALAAVLVFMLAHYIVHSRAGRGLAAIREDETAAGVIGVDVIWYKVSIFTITAMIAGLAGGLFAYQLEYVSPESFNLDWSIAVLSMVIIGGKRSAIGAVVGAVIVTIVTQLLFSVGDLQFLVYGVWIIVIMLFLPEGLVSIWGMVRRGATSEVGL